MIKVHLADLPFQMDLSNLHISKECNVLLNFLVYGGQQYIDRLESLQMM